MLQNRIALIAAQKQAKQEHLTETNRFKAFLDSTADAVISFDRKGRTTFWNGGAERIFGYTAAEALGKSYTLIGPEEVHEFQHRVFTETLQGDPHQWYDTRRRHKNGSIIDVSITTSQLFVNGEVVGLVAIVRDITEKVRATQELQERNAQLDAMAREQQVVAQQLADLNAQLRAKAEEKRNFVNMVIHDLRHPLTTMRTLLHLLSVENNKKQRMADLKALENRTRALNTLLDELVLYDRIEMGQSLRKIEAIDLPKFLPACVEEIVGHTEMQTVPVRCEVAPGLDIVYLDQRKLRHILQNLISNALKFTQKGYIAVRALPENEMHWRLEVEDTGTGMTSAVRERAFEEYFSESSREQDGVGLGLAIAHRLSIALEAKMTLSSAPGEGTLFQLVFPRHLAPAGENQAPANREETAAPLSAASA
jgi:PAS domain S-box-containing protein